MDEPSSGHLFADPKLRSTIRWGETDFGARLSNFSLGAWVTSFLVFAAVQFAWSVDAPLSTAAGNGIILAAGSLIVIGMIIDGNSYRERGGK
jgi:hypothetical protein